MVNKVIAITLIIGLIYLTVAPTVLLISDVYKKIKSIILSIRYNKASVHYTYVDRFGKLKRKKDVDNNKKI